MRVYAPLALLLAAGCAGTLYSSFAGPATSPPDAVFACVQAQTKELGYARTQYNEKTRWYVAQRTEQNQVSSGLYRKTLHVLDTQVKEGASGTELLITAHTYDEYTNAKGTEREERKAAESTVRDARLLGQACVK